MKKKYVFDVLDRCNHSFWSATIMDVKSWGAYHEIIVQSRGSQFIVLFGSSSTTRWILLPEHDIGCSQSFPEDLFWNTERLCDHLNYPDALTIVSAVAFLYAGSDIND